MIVSPESKYTGTRGVTSHIAFMYELLTYSLQRSGPYCHFYRLDLCFKSSSYLTETLLDPELGHANEADKAAFNKAHNTEQDMWGWLERPDKRSQLMLFGAAMTSVNSTSSNDILKGSVMLRGFDKKSSDFDISELW